MLVPMRGWWASQLFEWARECFCDWDEDTCSFVALNGHLSCLNWARENACEWDEEDFCFCEEHFFFCERTEVSLGSEDI